MFKKYVVVLISLCFFYAVGEVEHSETQDIVVESDELIYTDTRDPLERMNRAIWDFNYFHLDKWILKPVSHTYHDYVPNPIQKGFESFVFNLKEPLSFVNSLLQFKMEKAATALWRFVINSTVGLGGLIDVAAKTGLERDIQYFSDTLNFWHVPTGPYLMIPVLGPSNLRDITTSFVDYLYFPFEHFNFLEMTLYLLADGLIDRVNLIPQEPLLENALDSYSFVKETYFQYLYKHNQQKQDIDLETDIELDFLDELD